MIRGLFKLAFWALIIVVILYFAGVIKLPPDGPVVDHPCSLADLQGISDLEGVLRFFERCAQSLSEQIPGRVREKISSVYLKASGEMQTFFQNVEDCINRGSNCSYLAELRVEYCRATSNCEGRFNEMSSYLRSSAQRFKEALEKIGYAISDIRENPSKWPEAVSRLDLGTICDVVPITVFTFSSLKLIGVDLFEKLLKPAKPASKACLALSIPDYIELGKKLSGVT